MDQTSRLLMALNGHEQGPLAKLGAQMISHGPADDLAGRHLPDGGHIEPILMKKAV